MNKPAAIAQALDWLADHGQPLPPDLRLKLEEKGLYNHFPRAAKQAASIEEANSVYHDAITQALIDYFESSGSITAPRNQFKQAMSDAFISAFELGWIDGGQELPLDNDGLDWLAARQSEEFGHIDALMQEAKELRKEEDFDYFSWITARADGYTASVMSVYNAAVLLAQKNKTGTWHLGATEVHCKTCASLDGQRHRASWYLNRGYIPRKPGASMECGGYNCDCSITDDDGNEMTI